MSLIYYGWHAKLDANCYYKAYNYWLIGVIIANEYKNRLWLQQFNQLIKKT